MPDPLPWLRRTSLAEAVSYLLLGAAMVLKYGWGWPWGVRVLGLVHGVLFLVLFWLLVRARVEKQWPAARLGLILVASLVPIWPFLLDRRMCEWVGAPSGRPGP